MVAWMVSALVLGTGCSATAKAPDELASIEVGAAAPAFTLRDLTGTEHSLADYAGKVVVLEWFNPGCPYVKDVHNPGGVLEKMPAVLQEQGVVWLAINSGAPGKQGHGVEANKTAKAGWSMDYPVLVDEDGSVGKAYGAKTTPHMYVIDAAGVLQYEGAVDNHPLREKSGDHKPYAKMAVDDLLAGRKVGVPRTRPYGCSVKY